MRIRLRLQISVGGAQLISDYRAESFDLRAGALGSLVAGALSGTQ